LTKLNPDKKELEFTLTPPYVKLRLTWEKKEGRKLSDKEFKQRLEVHLRKSKRPRDPVTERALKRLNR